jgi:hypothetical protein
MSEERYDETQQMLLEAARRGRPRVGLGTLLGDLLDPYIDPESSMYDPSFAEELARVRPDWVFTAADRDRHKYNTKGYARYEGKTFGEIHAELRKVFKEYPEYSDPVYGGGSFIDMVRLFAEDDFYNLHYVARAYLANTMTDGPLVDPIDTAADPSDAPAPRP